METHPLIAISGFGQARTSRPGGYGVFDPELLRLELAASSGLGNSVPTLLFMLDWADTDGWTCISKIRIADALGISERTVQRHWATARQHGYLRSLDYPAEERRTSDHWLMWPGLRNSSGCPGLDALADLYPSKIAWPGTYYSEGNPPF